MPRVNSERQIAQNKKYASKVESKVKETPGESAEQIRAEIEQMLNLRQMFNLPEINAAGAASSYSSGSSFSSGFGKKRTNDHDDDDYEDGGFPTEDIVYGPHIIKAPPKETVGDLIDQMNEIQSYMNMFIEGYVPHAPPIDLRLTGIATKDIRVTEEIHRMNALCNELSEKLEAEKSKSANINKKNKKNNNKNEPDSDDDSQLDSDDFAFHENDEVYEEEDPRAPEIQAMQVRAVGDYDILTQEDVEGFEEMTFEFERLCMVLEMFWESKKIEKLDDHLDSVVDYASLF